MLNNLIIHIPQNVKLVIWQKKNNKDYLNIYLYNNNKKYNLNINYSLNNLKIDNNSNSIIIYGDNLDYSKKKISNFFFDFLKSWNIFFFKKIKFKGKGFRLRFFKKNKFLKFFFGKSHKTFMFFKKIIMKKINKYKFVLKSINKNKVNVDSSRSVNIRPLNLYTLRGLRSSRQIICKRKGKKGTYI